MELITTQYESSGSWIVGIKQLIDMVERSKIPAHSVSQVQSQSNGQNSLPLQNRQPPQISSTSQAYTGQTIYTNTMNQSQALAPPPIHSRDQMPSQQLQSTYQPRFIPNMNLPQDQMRPPASHQGYHSTQSQISELSLPAQGPLYQQPSSQFQIVPTPQINGQLPLGQTYPGGHYGTR